jgi:hypothetical protein
MTEVFQHASDDQVALALCLGAVGVCGLIMHFSHHLGKLTGHIRLHDEPSQPAPSIRPAKRGVPAVLSETPARDKAA